MMAVSRQMGQAHCASNDSNAIWATEANRFVRISVQLMNESFGKGLESGFHIEIASSKSSTKSSLLRTGHPLV